MEPPPPWLRPYAPTPVLRAAEVLADHVDFWEEEAFRVDGRWRERELTEFIRRGSDSDRTQSHRFKQLLVDYIEMSGRHPPKDEESHSRARRRMLSTAVVEVRKWLRVEGEG